MKDNECIHLIHPFFRETRDECGTLSIVNCRQTERRVTADFKVSFDELAVWSHTLVQLFYGTRPVVIAEACLVTPLQPAKTKLCFV